MDSEFSGEWSAYSLFGGWGAVWAYMNVYKFLVCFNCSWCQNESWQNALSPTPRLPSSVYVWQSWKSFYCSFIVLAIGICVQIDLTTKKVEQLKIKLNEFFEMNFISWLESLKTRAVNVSNSITCGTNHNFANEVWTLVWSGNSMVYARWLVHSLAALLIFKYLDSPSECFRAHSSRIFQHGLQKKCKNKKWCSSTWKFVLFQVQNGDFFLLLVVALCFIMLTILFTEVELALWSLEIVLVYTKTLK